MNVTIKNFGPIKRFDFDLSKDLSVIFGKNNIGKSYAISSLYIILKHIISDSSKFSMYGDRNAFSQSQSFFLFSRLFQTKTEPSKLLKKVDELKKDSKVTEIDITHDIEMLIAGLAGALVEKINNSFVNSFGQVADFSNKQCKESMSINLACDKMDMLIKTEGNLMVIDKIIIKQRVNLKRVQTNRVNLYSQNYTTVYIPSSAIKAYNKSVKEPGSQMTKLYASTFDVAANTYSSFLSETSDIVSNVYFLPASRSGLYQALSTFSAVIAELSKSRNFVTSNTIELPTISEPVSDYFLKLSNISTNVVDGRISEIAKQIERKILNGFIKFNKDTKKLIFVQGNIGSELDLSVASSMVSEIAPIVAYLKYIIQNEQNSSSHGVRYRQTSDSKFAPAHLLFIEEPEAHLHPEVQVQMMEFFSVLVKNKIKIIMTTHSNYMFNKMNNLILSGDLDFTSVASYLMKKTEEGSVADEMTMKAIEFGVEDENFSDVAEILYDERLGILEAINQKVK